MTLHNNQELFSELITQTSELLGIPEIYIEKDYWVTYVLHSLSELDEAMRDKVVFKGGTSLSKAHKLIERFSEDIDLAVIADGMNGSQTKRLLKDLEQRLAGAPFVALPDHPQVSKGSEYRKSAHAYPQIKEGNFGDAANVIILELNTFAHPTPNSMMLVSTYIHDFLSEKKAESIIADYALSPIKISVLDLERTLCEKISAIARASYEGAAELQKKIRHFYDIYLLLQQAEMQAFVESSAFDVMMDIVKKDDSDNMQFHKDWASKDLLDAPVFQETSATFTRLHAYYHRTFKMLVYGELPNLGEIERTMLHLGDRLKHCSYP